MACCVTAVVVACQPVESIEVEVTREIQVTREVSVRETIEVTREIPVTREIQVTRVFEATPDPADLPVASWRVRCSPYRADFGSVVPAGVPQTGKDSCFETAASFLRRCHPFPC